LQRRDTLFEIDDNIAGAALFTRVYRSGTVASAPALWRKGIQ
jgi:hypothetical protein